VSIHMGVGLCVCGGWIVEEYAGAEMRVMY
jgi:hypothetical protein